ncbi:hypothetical protein H5410_036694 [Solanum commersonii]|uniref:Uncharacterized protein n=1 Tax=Solanum commersonii TaxID=4109 RepID=A0A9J5Y8Y0_SOLCO|nr:hypothetical protein H5410_036694 [Solanum commersonii]
MEFDYDGILCGVVLSVRNSEQRGRGYFVGRDTYCRRRSAVNGSQLHWAVGEINFARMLPGRDTRGHLGPPLLTLSMPNFSAVQDSSTDRIMTASPPYCGIDIGLYSR